MKKLINMTDYVLESVKNINEVGVAFTLIAIEKYANFLKTPLELGMFVPCEEDGNVLEEPSSNDKKYHPENNGVFRFVTEAYNYDVKKYNQAKENVIFEIFEADFEEGVIDPFLGLHPIGFFNEENIWVLSN